MTTGSHHFEELFLHGAILCAGVVLEGYFVGSLLQADQYMGKAPIAVVNVVVAH